jgi:hypothetical protein
LVGADDVVYGTAISGNDGVPFPAAVTARTRYAYVLPLVKPVAVYVVPDGVAAVVHVVPLSVDT